jgi:hypothetical protein
MPCKIEVTDVKIDTISGKSNKTGKDFSFRKQSVWLHTPTDVYPKQTEIILSDDITGYPKGFYLLDDTSIYVDRNGRLAINPVLKPMPTSPVQQPAGVK